MSVTSVRSVFERVAADGVVDAEDINAVLTEAGSINAGEEKELKRLADQFDVAMNAQTKGKLKASLREIASLRKEAAARNQEVQLLQTGLTQEVQALVTPGAATHTFGGTLIPEAVKQVVGASGGLSYDVRELKPDPVYDTSEGPGELTLAGKYNPYAQEQAATDSMAFGYTELTPEKIADDMNTVQQFNVVNGYQNNEAVFELVSMKGNGRITELYDEASWSDTFARGPGGQKYASNFAILADGSVHAVPASRRSAAEPWRILTTASLGRGKQMLFNGHLHMEQGVVTYVGMSGRLCKLQQDGAIFVDPVKVLKAWGFKLAPGLAVTNEG